MQGPALGHRPETCARPFHHPLHDLAVLFAGPSVGLQPGGATECYHESEIAVHKVQIAGRRR